MAIAFISSLVNNSALSATSLSMTVPAGGYSVGSLIIVSVVGFNYTSGAVSVTDTGGNTYQSDWARNNSSDGLNNTFSSILTTQLNSGDTIVAHFPASDQGYAVSADVFSGIVTSSWLLQTGTSTTAASTTPSESITPSSPPTNILIFGFLTFANSSTTTVTEDADNTGGDTWHPLTDSLTAIAATGAFLHRAYKIPTTSSTAQTYNPTISVTHSWYEQLEIFSGLTTSLLPLHQYRRGLSTVSRAGSSGRATFS